MKYFQFKLSLFLGIFIFILICITIPSKHESRIVQLYGSTDFLINKKKKNYLNSNVKRIQNHLAKILDLN